MVYYPPGGGVDYMTRMISKEVATTLGQPVVVENKPGAGGIIGMQALARAAADGYTMMTVDIGISMAPSLYKDLTYDVKNDFQTVTLFSKVPFIFVINPERVPVTSFQEFISYVKQRKEPVNYASYGVGSLAHVMTELLQSRADIDLLHIPYKGAGPATQDMLAGNIDAMFTDYSTAKAHLASGKLRALAVSTAAKHPLMPELPTFVESGVSDFDVAVWTGVMVPKGTPPEAVKKLGDAIRTAVHSPAISEPFLKLGLVPTTSTPEEFSTLLNHEMTRWSEVINSAQIKLEQ